MRDWDLRPARDLDLPLARRLGSTRREPGLVECAAHRLWAAASAAYFGLWHRLQVRGREHLPAAAPFILIANHTSHLDALVLAAAVPWGVRRTMFPIAAGDVFFETPVRTALAALFLNALPMWRHRVGRHALDDLRARLLQDPCAFILFPEGTRSPGGTLLRFKPGLGMLVAGTAVPVIPAHIDGAFQALPRTARLPRPHRIRVRVGPPLTFAATPNDRAGWESVTRAAEDAVRALARP